jgi:small subunit ribosomal protein S19e
MVTVYDVDPTELIKETAKALKEQKISVPAWVPFVKTGAHNERPPVDRDWWYTRCAAVLRTIAIRGPVGTSKLRTKYGGKKNRGVKPECHYKGSGSVIRHAMQSLELLGLVAQNKDVLHKGRIATAKGIKLLDGCARIVAKTAAPVVVEETKEATE